MRKIWHISIYLLLVFTYTGCGNISTSSSSLEVEGLVLTDKYHAISLVCIDSNANYSCDDEEVQTYTTKDGIFFIDAQVGDTLHSEVLYPDENEKSISYMMRHKVSSVDEKAVLSPSSSLIYAISLIDSDYNIKEELATLLDVDSSLFCSDYIASDEKKIIKLAKILKYAQLFSYKSMHKNYSLEDIYIFSKKVIMRHLKKLNKHASSNVIKKRTISRSQTSAISSHWEDSMEFGRGYDILKEKVIVGSNCVEFDSSKLIQPKCTHSSSYDFTLVDEESDVLKKLNVGLRVSLDVVVATATGTVNYVKEIMKDKHKLYVMISKSDSLCPYARDASEFRLKVQKAQLFKNDYSSFREECGDAFLSSIQSGGYFLGIFKLDYENDKDKEELKIKLKAKVLGATVYSKTWKERVDTMFNEMKASYSVNSNFITANSNYDTDMTAFYNYFDSYNDKINSSKCNLENGLSSCKYLSYFYNYSVLSSDYSSNIGTQESILDEYNLYAQGYDELDNKLHFIESKKVFFPNFTTDDIDEVRSEIIANKSILKKYALNCENLTKCIELKNLTDIHSAAEIASKHNLPQTDLLAYQSCQEFYNDNKTSDMSNITLYAQRDISKFFNATCVMEDNKLETYLAFVHHPINPSFDTNQLRHNYSTAQGLKDSNNNAKYSMVSIFDKVKIEPCSIEGECFTVHWDDSKALKTIVNPKTDGNLFHNDGFKYSYSPLLSAYMDNSVNAYSSSRSNINLKDTPFIFDENTINIDASSISLSQDLKSIDITLEENTYLHLAEPVKIYYDNCILYLPKDW